MATAREPAAAAARPAISPLHGLHDLLELHRQQPARYPFLLESAAWGTAQARYDLLFAFPGKCLWLDGHGRLHGGGDESGDFLTALDQEWSRARHPSPQGDLPFHGGWFLFLGYELAGQVEPVLRLRLPGQQPLAFATRVPVAVVRDRRSDSTWVITEPGWEDAALEIQADVARLPAATGMRTPPGLERLSEEPASRYVEAVRCAKRYIREGEIFQANLARAWHGRWRRNVAAAAVYRRLRRTNPAPFAGLAVWRDLAVISSSPERLIQVSGRRVQTRPIAGTRPRGGDGAQDRALRGELIAHPKERAEHVMLIDLERNDLGRICRPGSVRVDEHMVLESYAHVHHIVSNISGELEEGVTPGAAIRAVFPGGTITGCPKVRCMQLISELEAGPRGAYTGSMGYLGHDGRMDLNILIRTVLQHGDREFSFHAGAGIVADSEPARELEETRAKAKGMLMAVTDRSADV